MGACTSHALKLPDPNQTPPFIGSLQETGLIVTSKAVFSHAPPSGSAVTAETEIVLGGSRDYSTTTPPLSTTSISMSVPTAALHHPASPTTQSHHHQPVPGTTNQDPRPALFVRFVSAHMAGQANCSSCRQVTVAAKQQFEQVWPATVPEQKLLLARQPGKQDSPSASVAKSPSLRA